VTDLAHRPRPGRRALLTPETQATIVEAVEVGNYLRTAAQAAGVGQSTLLGWLARGRTAAALVATHEQDPDGDPDWQLPDEEVLYLEFLEEVTRAQTAAEVAAVRAWRSAFADDWRAARDYLARTSPERWAGVTRVQMTNEEAERRIDDAVTEALVAIGLDGTTAGDDPAELLAEGGYE
jgi:hypothetical protein